MKEHYLITKNDLRILTAKKQAKRDKKVDNSVDKYKKIQGVKTKGWKELLDFCEENLSLISSESNLLKNCRGIPRRFWPSDRQIESIFSIYTLARDEGFSSKNFPSDF